MAKFDIKSSKSFKVVGVEIGNWNSTLQYAFCTTGVMIFLLLYGYLQELVVMNKFKRSLGWFVTFLQLTGYAVFAFLQNFFVGAISERKIPFSHYFILAILQVIMQGLTNLSMHYLNYPAKTLFKSSRVIMTMLFGVLFLGKRYSLQDHAVALSMVIGLTTFVAADANSSPEFDIKGIVLIMLALSADAAILNLQEHCLHIFSASHDELVYYSNIGAAGVSLLISIVSGEFVSGIAFLKVIGSVNVFLLFMSFAWAGFLGVSCLAALTKRFGALASAITSVIRKGLTLIFSYVFFPEDKVFTSNHFLGAVIFMSGLLFKSLSRSTVVNKGSPYTTPDNTNGYIQHGSVPNHGAFKGVTVGYMAVKRNSCPSNSPHQPEYGQDIKQMAQQVGLQQKYQHQEQVGQRMWYDDFEGYRKHSEDLEEQQDAYGAGVGRAGVWSYNLENDSNSDSVGVLQSESVYNIALLVQNGPTSTHSAQTNRTHTLEADMSREMVAQSSAPSLLETSTSCRLQS